MKSNSKSTFFILFLFHSPCNTSMTRPFHLVLLRYFQMPKSISVEKNSTIAFPLLPNDIIIKFMAKVATTKTITTKLLYPLPFQPSMQYVHDTPFPTNTVVLPSNAEHYFSGEEQYNYLPYQLT